MALDIGTRVGSYEVLAAIGAGGMGEVYRARDRRLDRDVALKILPEAFAADADRAARFQREARTLAALNHPNIASIYGVEDGGGSTALVMELVEGEDLAQRIARGPIPVDEALRVARQIVEALEAAHERGIIHRDLKPANVKVRTDGTVKVLDFGLAKALDLAASGSGAPHAPTVTSPAVTEPGIILGTAAYMSPEQARGTAVDRRADIWAFGCVLYEMLTGRRAFAGDHVSEVLASVLAREPDLEVLPSAVPESIRRLLRRCLQKDPFERLRDIGDARLELTDAIGRRDPDVTARSGREERGARVRFAWMLVAIALAATLSLAAALALRSGTASPETRVDIATPPTAVPQSFAISPDGRTIAFVASAGTESRLWVRSLDSAASRSLPGTEGAENPFWSPDGRAIGFFADGRIKRVDTAGGAVQTLAPAQGNAGSGTWSEDDVILFATLGEPIRRVSAAGGEPIPVQGLVQQGSVFSPSFLPGGRRFLYYVRGNPEVRGVYAANLDGTPLSGRLIESEAGAVYAASGHLLFVRDGRLYAQQFDAARLAFGGDPGLVAEDVISARQETVVSVSSTGTVAYRSSAVAVRRQFVWFDRAGREIDRIGVPVSTGLSRPMLSPDEQRIAFYRQIDGNADVWIVDARRGAPDRLTSHGADDVLPVWSPDSRRIAFSSNRRGAHDLYVKPATGERTEELLLSSPRTKYATDWSQDGRHLLFTDRDPKGGLDVWAFSIAERKAFPIVRTTFDEEGAQFAPDGKWIAYHSNETGRHEVYVREFPGPGRKWLVSTGGGAQVRWTTSGKELFYVAADGRLMAVSIGFGTDGSAEIGTPVPLFAPPLGGSMQRGDYRHQYGISSDGRRILVAGVSTDTVGPIALILNWKGP